ncbi:site-specific DNA-methyltransferase [Neisseria sp. Marseille-Q6792]|uniref:site-specific DNA-methyltransferase n=1 Tax=Neisseria sp. Marseille-Q6792 TaxID=2937985 RepID=UPI0020254B8D|nr:site-specific DNA-methyltransferase [Neisseria sp. Marseille-Q6792]
MFIEAENLEALKILQKSYAGSVKMIYIDPPYNTGSDSFIYPDKFSESREEYARRVGDTDDAGYLKRDGVFQGVWRKNGKDSGHYHSNWLNMMLPRLHLAKTLLRDDGVIFISIDDNEQAQLKLLCDEVFGAENFVIDTIRKTKSTTNDAKTGINIQHENCLVYAKNKNNINLLGREKDLGRYSNPDNDPNGAWISDNPSKSGYAEIQQYPITNPYTGKIDYPPEGRSWIPTKNTLQKHIDEGRICFKKSHKPDERGFIYKRYLKDLKTTRKTFDSLLFADNEYMNQNATKLLKEIGLVEYFTFPKGVSFIQKIIEHSTEQNSIVLDFFCGSGTTAHAVMQLNAEDGGSRRFICVQLPEETDEKSEARKAGFNTIAEIAKERIRRAGRQISDGLQSGQNVDTGFKVFKLAESGFKQWRQPGQADTEALQRELLLNIDSVLSETSSENLLYELMLRMGLKLTCKVSFSDDVYFVEDEDTGGLYAFLLKRVDQGLIDAVLAKHPVKVAALDRLFEGDDALKSNTVLQMKDAGVMFECV